MNSSMFNKFNLNLKFKVIYQEVYYLQQDNHKEHQDMQSEQVLISLLLDLNYLEKQEELAEESTATPIKNTCKLKFVFH